MRSFVVPRHAPPSRSGRRGLVALVGLAMVVGLLVPAGPVPAGAALSVAQPVPSGYWAVASDGGIFAFGDARFFGSTGAVRLNKPIVGMAATPSGNGYWLTASDGGIFAFGDAAFHGAAANRGDGTAPPEVVGLVRTPTGAGYWQVAAQGEMFAFGDAADLGGVSGLNRPLVAMAALPAVVPESGSDDLPVAGAGPGAAPEPDPGRNPGSNGGVNPPPTTTTTVPPLVEMPRGFFSGEFEPSWGTSPSEDPEEVGRSKAGRVLAVAEAGDIVFVAGEFAGVTPPGVSTKAATADPTTILRRPYLVALDARSGALLDWDAQPNDAVLSLAVSPDGRRLYVGGRFRSIGGGPAGRVAVLDIATGKLDPTFKAPLADSGVRAMSLVGDTLYIGGSFTKIGDIARPGLAALNATTGALRTAFVPPANTGGRYKGQTGTPTEDGDPGLVHDLAVTADGRLIVAGDFLHFGDQGGLLVLDARTGAKTAWQPTIGRPVHGVGVWPGDGITFFAAAGGTGGVVDAYRPDGPSKYVWRHRVDGDAEDVVATAKRVYLVGHYDYVLGDNTICGAPPCTGGNAGDVVNRHISAFDAVSGAHDLDYAPQLNTPQGPYVAFIGARHLYVGGDFTEVNGKPQPGFVKFPGNP